jgi:hypothetical protein
MDFVAIILFIVAIIIAYKTSGGKREQKERLRNAEDRWEGKIDVDEWIKRDIEIDRKYRK